VDTTAVKTDTNPQVTRNLHALTGLLVAAMPFLGKMAFIGFVLLFE
jgi:hypothetical protein